MRRTSLLAIAPLFIVAACSAGESAHNTPTPEARSSVTQESSAQNESATPPPQSSSRANTTPSSAAGDTGVPHEPVDYVASDYLDLIMRNPAPGQTATVAGTYYEVCVLGDGFGLHTILAGENTSCGFGTAILDAQTAGHNPTGENIRDFYQPEISVTSPTTGQTYAMQCGVLEDNSLECTGGNNARVVYY